MEGVVVPRTAVRVVLVLVALLVTGFGGAVEARGEGSPPVLELLGPANGDTVVISPDEHKWATYHVRVTFPADWAGLWSVDIESALDQSFTQNRERNGQACAPNVSVCEVTFAPLVNYPPGTRVYWHARIGDLVVSSTQTFVTVGPADRDHDGVPDFKDNCPSVANPTQTDFEGDHKGDACQPDTQTPRVKAYTGSQHRGQYARFKFKVYDNRPVTLRLTVRWHGQLALSGSMLQVDARTWNSYPFTWVSEHPLNARLPLGTYTYCASATDAAGHKGSSCVPYRITA
ncbi:MAG: large repetitive protein [Gaiellaceae bacterium]|nr:large repetitive protein [Gaiellaceae bacterium]